ncbi:asparagine synthase (glutamine-hydrolyzing) [Salmonirosea aquatica]|uniref:asparagine synthase (glutamine-hydrolyzing) n=1 Tax=Salmonirosea aquatica TaxID=2654236 RepID=A0A7C9FNV9_9BACT|nr:asparagine synthase (glutamine-hydrolyzing) [Cytophagaceae bacterium SJW1-29]
MCGILGVYSLDGSPIQFSESQFDEAISRMKHRGPDATGRYTAPDRSIELGHVRLSIIDLSNESNQPFHYGNLCLIFNGEIYNYLEIREELVSKGYKFRTTSDTEVLAAAYQEWGYDCLLRFNGMWAFALYDKDRKSLFLARDRFGIKPCYYHADQHAFYFGSVIKSLLVLKPALRTPNLNTIAGYCRESVGGESLDTWFENVSRLAPAHYMVIRQGQTQTIRYWDYPDNEDTTTSFQEATHRYRTLFEDATRIRLRTDVPYGATLSSGIDSQSIVAMAQRISGRSLYTYTASFPDKPYDEFKTVESLQKDMGYRAHQQRVDYTDFLPDLRLLVYHLEGGHSSPAIFPLSQVLQRAKQDIIVFLEGQGADELLAGYINAIFCEYWLDRIKAGELKASWTALRAFRKNWSLTYAGLLFLRTSLPARFRTLGRKAQGIENIYGTGLSKYRDQPPQKKFSGLLKQRLYEQHTGGLVNLLHYGDNISMMHSLESRLPFMDYRLVEYVFRLPDSYLIHQGMGKYLHRQAMQGIVPNKLLDDRNKIGFTSPFEEVFQNRDLLNYIKSHPVVTQEHWFDQVALDSLIENVERNRKKQHRLLFRILSVALWYDAFLQPEISGSRTP